MELSYRKSTFNEEIIQLLQGYVQHKWPLLLWQSHERNAARHVQVLNLNVPRKQISVSFNGMGPKLDLTKSIYCHGEEKKLVFKTLYHPDPSPVLTLQVQEELRLIELRKNQRFEMYSNKNAFLTVVVASHYESKETSYVLKMFDISHQGCSVVMHSRNLMHIQEGQQVRVSHVGSDVVTTPLTAIVKHILPMKSPAGRTEVQLYKVGLSFSYQITFFNYFLTRNLEW